MEITYFPLQVLLLSEGLYLFEGNVFSVPFNGNRCLDRLPEFRAIIFSLCIKHTIGLRFKWIFI